MTTMNGPFSTVRTSPDVVRVEIDVHDRLEEDAHHKRVLETLIVRGDIRVEKGTKGGDIFVSIEKVSGQI